MAEDQVNHYGRPARATSTERLGATGRSSTREVLDSSRLRADEYTQRLTVELTPDLYKKMRRAALFHDGGIAALVRAFIDALPTSADRLVHIDVQGPWEGKKLTADISPDQRRALKVYAFEHDSTVAAVMRDFVASLGE